MSLQPADACPVCGNTFATALDMAVHVCPITHPTREPTPAQIEKASLAQKEALVAKLSIRPTVEHLTADAGTIARTVATQWGGEVECIVILAPKGVREPIVVARYVEDRERARKLLREALRKNDEKRLPSA